MVQENWAEGPRPSFFGQLRGQRDGVGASPKSRNTTAAPSDDAETAWAQPLDEAAAESEESLLLRKEREAYVNGQFSKTFALDYGLRQVLALCVTLVLAAIFWRYVPAVELAAWLALRAAVGGWRLLRSTRHRRHPLTGPAQQAYSRQMTAMAALSGMVLGTSVLLFFGRIPASLQFACWLILAVAVTLPIHSLAFDPPRVTAYVNGLFATVLACVLFRILGPHTGLSHDMEHRHYESWFLAFPVVQWVLVLFVARRVQSNARTNFELEFYKQALIDTLADRQREAEEAVRIKNRFIATAAHDMRQPVVALSLFAEHLKEVPSDQEIVLPKVLRAAAAVGRLFESLFDLARMDNEQLQPRAERMDIAEVMRDLRDQFESLARSRGVTLRMRTVQRRLTSDPMLVRRLIGNIVSNAIKYTEPGRKVLISARHRGRHVAVEVWDQGFGIEPGELRKIFTEFYKVQGPSENHEGLGLGLSIVARLAHALHARVSVRSRPGHGTVFRLLLEADQPGAPRALVMPPPGAG
ncbi:HAMP domain-containing sensor histidine kinase [Variovorax sp. OV329]|uniref:sensor histidine kinase n=1 Tax=Variovorax sp. OV329 TaxID=1882825 RepID=UPI0008DFDBA6|nr:HAMP domain-containing sensor histidine kinase [Variovorax sp. OV329]SFM58299.1 Signal transduction histidine kinase [Variovorax sp. OV329]